METNWIKGASFKCSLPYDSLIGAVRDYLSSQEIQFHLHERNNTYRDSRFEFAAPRDTSSGRLMIDITEKVKEVNLSIQFIPEGIGSSNGSLPVLSHDAVPLETREFILTFLVEMEGFLKLERK